MNNKRFRKYQLTINNPIEKGFSHDEINRIMNSHPYLYYCLCDEVGEQNTPHTHVFMCFENAVGFSTIKKRFPPAHIEAANGSCEQNRDYIRKEGKYLDSDKKETNLIETFEEYGEMPLDTSEKNKKISEQVYEMLKNEASISEIVQCFPSYATKIPHLEQARQMLLQEKYSNVFRKLEIIYIYGDTGTGKTRHVMEKHGYNNVYKVTNYKNTFDGYTSQDVILFDEFRSSIPLSDMLQYLDGYPCRLPARYADRTACYTKVYIISNIPLNEQYKNMQAEQPASWNAFVRRINRIFKYEVNNGSLMTADEVIQFEELTIDYLI